MTRDEMLAHIRKVAQQWGVQLPPVAVQEQATDAQLRALVAKLYRIGEKLARPQ